MNSACILLTWLTLAAVVVSKDPIVVDGNSGGRLDNPAFAKTLGQLRAENVRLEDELSALRTDLAKKVRPTPHTPVHCSANFALQARPAHTPTLLISCRCTVVCCEK
jgi:hypothetical protein